MLDEAVRHLDGADGDAKAGRSRRPGAGRDPRAEARAQVGRVGLFDMGTGTPMVVVPGITGRWEWMRPGLEALAAHGRVISYSLWGERTSGAPRRPLGSFDGLVDQLGAVLDQASVRRAVVCGVSLGGYVALTFAARHPSRVAGLVLASTPDPCFAPDVRQRWYMRAPVVLAPWFVATARGRLSPEIRTAIPGMGARWAFTGQQIWRIARAPASPRRMAARIRQALAHDFAGDCAEVRVPTLVVTGQAPLDRVVPVPSSQAYLGRIQGARHAVVQRTGHLGIVTRPAAWAAIVAAFAREATRSEEAQP